jgi:hypothetical protein
MGTGPQGQSPLLQAIRKLKKKGGLAPQVPVPILTLK